MPYDSFNFSFLKIFSLGFTKHDEQIKLKEGETILLRYWNWKKFGYSRKAYSVKDGITKMEVLD